MTRTCDANSTRTAAALASSRQINFSRRPAVTIPRCSTLYADFIREADGAWLGERSTVEAEIAAGPPANLGTRPTGVAAAAPGVDGDPAGARRRRATSTPPVAEVKSMYVVPAYPQRRRIGRAGCSTSSQRIAVERGCRADPPRHLRLPDRRDRASTARAGYREVADYNGNREGRPLVRTPRSSAAPPQAQL